MNSEELLNKMLYQGGFGLEEENQRVTEDGFFSSRPHPFDSPKIDRDFCESQLEFITGVSHSADAAAAELASLRNYAGETLLNMKPEPEYIWPFSNPPYIRNDDDIHIAQFTGDKHERTIYRKHLAGLYGKRLQTLCGIHFNYSYPDSVEDYFKKAGTDANSVYLKLARQILRFSWFIVALTAASPLLDASYYDSQKLGKTEYGEYSSLRSSERGYWNSFVPILHFESIDLYVDSINSYIKSGDIYSFSELYYPVRLKSQAKGGLEDLKKGINHIELRMLDVNPLFKDGINTDDLTFITAFLAFLTDKILSGADSADPGHQGRDAKAEISPAVSAQAGQNLSEAALQTEDINNMKTAAHYPLEKLFIFANGERLSLTEEAGKLLEDIESWAIHSNADSNVMNSIELQKDKISNPQNRYSESVIDKFGSDFVKTGLKYITGK